MEVASFAQGHFQCQQILTFLLKALSVKGNGNQKSEAREGEKSHRKLSPKKSTAPNEYTYRKKQDKDELHMSLIGLQPEFISSRKTQVFNGPRPAVPQDFSQNKHKFSL